MSQVQVNIDKVKISKYAYQNSRHVYLEELVLRECLPDSLSDESSQINAIKEIIMEKLNKIIKKLKRPEIEKLKRLPIVQLTVDLATGRPAGHGQFYPSISIVSLAPHFAGKIHNSRRRDL